MLTCVCVCVLVIAPYTQVHSVKALFGEKEHALQAEMKRRDADKEGELRLALQAQQTAEAAASRAAVRVQEAESARQDAEQALRESRAERERLTEQLAARISEASAAVAEKGKVEGEMRLVLRAMDQQKAAATRNMQQLSKIYDDWSHASNM